VANFGVGVACLDFEGRILWQKWDQDYVRNTRYGAASSPLLTDDLAIVVQECEQFSKRPTWIAAFDKRTGLTRWRIEPENVRECFTTPLLYRDAGGAQLIIASWGNVASYDIESGKFLWMERVPTQQLVASMARSGELLCVGGGTWGPNVTIMMRLSNSNGPMDANTLWQSDKDTPWDCSPVIYDGKLFTISDTGKITCYDALTGAVFWNERLKGSRYLSSLVAGDGKVYACNTTGLTTVIAADAEFKIIAENDLNGRCYASPAIADGCVLLRIADYLYCIEKKSR
jgi:outer membrane protein assembly factor BamB